MLAGATEPGGDPPELHRRAEERPAERGPLFIVVLTSAIRGFEAEGGHLAARHLEARGENPAEPGFAALRHFALEDHHEAVIGLDVAGEVDGPREDVGKVPGEADPVVALDLFRPGGIGHRVVERGDDPSLEPNRMAVPADRSFFRQPAIVRPGDPGFEVGPDPHGHVGGPGGGVEVAEVEDLSGPDPPGIDPEERDHRLEVDRPDPMTAEEFA